MNSESVHTRRSAILAAAGDAMGRATQRRTRNARLVTATLLLLVGAIAVTLLTRPVAIPQPTTRLAIDFAIVGPRPHAEKLAMDFAVVNATTTPVLDTLTDEEAEELLAANGYCIKIFRVDERPMLVDCSTGNTAVIK